MAVVNESGTDARFGLRYRLAISKQLVSSSCSPGLFVPLPGERGALREYMRISARNGLAGIGFVSDESFKSVQEAESYRSRPIWAALAGAYCGTILEVTRVR